MPGLKSLVGAVCVATMITSPVFAADLGTLAPGKAAGVKQAQISDGTLIIGGIAVGVVAAVAIVVSNQNNVKSQALQSTAATVTTLIQK